MISIANAIADADQLEKCIYARVCLFVAVVDFSFLLFMNQIRIQIHPIRRLRQNESASGLLGTPRRNLFFSLLRRRGFKKIDDNSRVFPLDFFFLGETLFPELFVCDENARQCVAQIP